MNLVKQPEMICQNTIHSANSSLVTLRIRELLRRFLPGLMRIYTDLSGVYIPRTYIVSVVIDANEGDESVRDRIIKQREENFGPSYLGWVLPEFVNGKLRDDDRNIVLIEEPYQESFLLRGSYAIKEPPVYDGSIIAGENALIEYLEKHGLIIPSLFNNTDVNNVELLYRLVMDNNLISIERLTISSYSEINKRFERRISRLAMTLLVFVSIAIESLRLSKNYILIQTHEKFYEMLSRFFPVGINYLGETNQKKSDGSDDRCITILIDLHKVLTYAAREMVELYEIFLAGGYGLNGAKEA